MKALLFLGLMGTAATLHAMSFSHLDWEMACDNTHTCRMAGYQADNQTPISLLLTYPAGAQAKLRGQLQLLDAPREASLWINAQKQGVLQFKKQYAELNQAQLNKILATAKKNTRIELRSGQDVWRISDQGLTAVLLKADEYQKRVGTSSALLAKGNSSRQVRVPMNMPSYRIHNYQPGPAKQYALNSAQAKILMPLLKRSSKEDDCPNLWLGNDFESSKLTIYPINAQQVLVERPCWHGAYNFGAGMWLMSKDLKKVQQFVTASASSFSEGQIFAQHKGRGLGDCNTTDEWAFTGQRFTASYAALSLQCKGFLGGAWNLTTLVSKVRR